MRSGTAVLVKNARCRGEIRARNSDSTYSLTNRSAPLTETVVLAGEPPSRMHHAARYSPASQPLRVPVQLRDLILA